MEEVNVSLVAILRDLIEELQTEEEELVMLLAFLALSVIETNLSSAFNVCNKIHNERCQLRARFRERCGESGKRAHDRKLQLSSEQQQHTASIFGRIFSNLLPSSTYSHFISSLIQAALSRVFYI